jgi:hypothetical protein
MIRTVELRTHLLVQHGRLPVSLEMLTERPPQVTGGADVDRITCGVEDYMDPGIRRRQARGLGRKRQSISEALKEH